MDERSRTQRKRDGAEIFKIEKQRRVTYWMKQVFPVMLVIRNFRLAAARVKTLHEIRTYEITNSNRENWFLGSVDRAG